MTKLLTQNKKMKNTSIDGLKVFNFGIPALKSKSGIKTCPNASKCAAANGCYALQGAYAWSNVSMAYENRLQATLQENFVDLMSVEINKLLKNKNTKQLVIRIHDSGDFYNANYLVDWLNIIQKFPNVKFYAYTKMIELFKQGNVKRFLPKNFTVIFSMGGKLDHVIDVNQERHSRVFDSLESLQAAGYVDASHDDMLAIGENKKIGLVYHGTRSFKNTAWSKVS